jgi:excisionase family DNA binding protein
MPIVIAGETYYRTAEVCRLIGVSRNTLFRWLKEGKFGQQEYRDWRGWRLFTSKQLNSVRAATGQVKVVEITG